MSRTVKTVCDCCGNELTGVGFANDLFFTIIFARSKERVDYCYLCGEKIAKAMNEKIEWETKDSEKE